MEKWLEQRQYPQATVRQSWFKDAALAAQELATAEEEGETTALMFVFLQDQHKVLLKAMVAVASHSKKYSCFQTRQGSEQQTRCS
jgi:hypothetical protein